MTWVSCPSHSPPPQRAGVSWPPNLRIQRRPPRRSPLPLIYTVLQGPTHLALLLLGRVTLFPSGPVPAESEREQMPQVDVSPGLQSLGRWLEGVCPLAALLLCVFLYEHSIGLVIFLWLSVFLSQVQANTHALM